MSRPCFVISVFGLECAGIVNTFQPADVGDAAHFGVLFCCYVKLG